MANDNLIARDDGNSTSFWILGEKLFEAPNEKDRSHVIDVIKALRAKYSLGLKEAKTLWDWRSTELVDPPTEHVSWEEINQVVRILEALQAGVSPTDDRWLVDVFEVEKIGAISAVVRALRRAIESRATEVACSIRQKNS